MPLPTRTFLPFLFVLSLFAVGLSQRKRSSSAYENILQTNKPKCTEKNLKVAERKMVKLLAYGPRGRPYPSSLEEMKSFCTETSNLARQVEAFSKECAKREIHNLVGVFMYSMRSSILRNYCGKNLKKNLPYIRESDCLNRHVFSNYRCFEVFNNQTRALVNVKDDSVKIPFTCCNFHQFLHCLEGVMDSQSCSAPLKEYFLDIIRRSTAGLVDLVCSDYTDESDRCERLGPPPTAPNRKTYESFILALIDLIASMESFKTPSP